MAPVTMKASFTAIDPTSSCQVELGSALSVKYRTLSKAYHSKPAWLTPTGHTLIHDVIGHQIVCLQLRFLRQSLRFVRRENVQLLYSPIRRTTQELQPDQTPYPSAGALEDFQGINDGKTAVQFSCGECKCFAMSQFVLHESTERPNTDRLEYYSQDSVEANEHISKVSNAMVYLPCSLV